MRLGLVTIALGLALIAGPVEAKKPRQPPPQAALSKADMGRIFAEVAAAAAQGDRAKAADLLAEIVQDPAKAPAHGQAWALLAENFEFFELPLASVIAWGNALEMEPDSAVGRLPDILKQAEKVSEIGPVAEALAKDASIPVPDELRNRVSYLASRHHVREGNLGPALGMLMMGSSDQAGFEDIELLRGVVLSLQGRPADAVAPMLTAEAAAQRSGRDERFINRANLNIARAFYASDNFTQAIVHYAKVDRASDYWLDAQFERAWAHFRGQDLNGALAMLFTHQSPFFEEGYFNPDADLLRAYALFLMCKFPDATKQIDSFQAKWEPIRDEYAAVSMTPAEAFDDVGDYIRGNEPQLPIAIVRQFQGEDRMADAMAAVLRADQEIDRANGLGNGSGLLAAQVLTELRDKRAEREGQRVLERISSAKNKLDQYLTDVEITRLDLLNLEAQMYERAAATGTLEYGDHVGRIREMRKARKGYRVWPFQGEFWADELGWFVFDSRPDCPASMAAGEQPRP